MEDNRQAGMIADTTFGLDRQMRFARLSGDYNPIHVDPVAVRRALPGRLVVHGVNVLLWALDRVAGSFDGSLPEVGRIRARFRQFTYVDEPVHAELTARSADELKIRIIGNGVVRAEFRIGFGSASASPLIVDGGECHPPGAGPLDHRTRSICGRYGAIPFTGESGLLAADYPHAARWLHAGRIEALAAATRLVGMIYPGLHSILGGIDVRMMPEDGKKALAFRMDELRHGQIDAAISGGGIVGVLDCRVPNPPVVQPSCDDLRALVEPGRYAGAKVLVIGGSRGAGEASAKLLALGGAEVVITYRHGADDAAAVAADIAAAGGACEVRHYDTAGDPASQLSGLDPTHACWFATPAMIRPDLMPFDRRRRDECEAVLTSGFLAVATLLHKRRREIRLLYPAMQERGAAPPGTIDYRMAKAAGEVLARSLETLLPRCRVLVPRLPAMATDQTARLGIEGAGAAETMLPHLDAFARCE